MTRRLVALVGLAVLAGTLVLVGGASPAGAETGSKRYERGDAMPAVDIVRLHVRNGEHRFTMRASVRDLRERGHFGFHYWAGRHQAPPAHSLIVDVHRAQGETRPVFFACGREDCAPVTCHGLRVRWRPAADLVAVSAPQRCYPGRDAAAGPPDQGRFFAWSNTRTGGDPGSSPFLLARG